MAVFSRRQAIVRQIAEDYGAIFIPTQERLNTLVKETAPILTERGCDIDPMKYWLWDGVHPTEAFHYYLAELWLEAAKEIL
jgi:phospholipase/lecithinase/hemolysin